MYYEQSTCIYYGHSTCMYYGHSTCMYCEHNTCMYHDRYMHSSCPIESHSAKFRGRVKGIEGACFPSPSALHRSDNYATITAIDMAQYIKVSTITKRLTAMIWVAACVNHNSLIFFPSPSPPIPSFGQLRNDYSDDMAHYTKVLNDATSEWRKQIKRVELECKRMKTMHDAGRYRV